MGSPREGRGRFLGRLIGIASGKQIVLKLARKVNSKSRKETGSKSKFHEFSS